METSSIDKCSLMFPNTERIDIQNFEGGEPSFDLAWRSKSVPWTGCNELVRLADGWLKTCSISHRCWPPTGPNWYPTRLLKLSKRTVRLIRPKDETEFTSPYATLSYCWGLQKFKVLDSSTMRKFQKGVRIDSLPRTFRDTIQLLKSLQIEYLWIDSYCIVQGSDDWNLEAGTMEDVYRHSYLNIGSTNFMSPYQGLFCERLPHNSDTLFLRWKPKRSEPQRRYVLRSHIKNMSSASLGLNYTQLARRAWVIQETILSPRLLSFTDQQVVWQCSENTACEDFPIAQPVLSHDAGVRSIFWALTDFAKPLEGSQYRSTVRMTAPSGGVRRRNIPTRSFEESWFEILHLYSMASLSYPEKDMFRAIEGVGNRLAHLVGSDYRNGMLAGCLEISLLWFIGPYEKSPASSVAPSWHWASRSVFGSVYYRGVANLYARAREQRRRFSPMAYVFLSDDCRQLATRQGARDLWPHLVGIGRLTRVKLVRSQSKEDEFWVDLLYPRERPRLEVHLDDPFSKMSNHNFLMYLPLVVQHGRVGDFTEVIKLKVYGLLLQAKGQGRYKRIGCADASFYTDEEALTWDRIVSQPPKLFTII